MEDKNKKLEYLFLKTVLKSFLAFWDGFFVLEKFFLKIECIVKYNKFKKKNIKLCKKMIKKCVSIKFLLKKLKNIV